MHCRYIACEDVHAICASNASKDCILCIQRIQSLSFLLIMPQSVDGVAWVQVDLQQKTVQAHGKSLQNQKNRKFCSPGTSMDFVFSDFWFFHISHFAGVASSDNLMQAIQKAGYSASCPSASHTCMLCLVPGTKVNV